MERERRRVGAPVERGRAVSLHREARDDTDHRRDGNAGQKADEAEHRAEGGEREDQPDRVQAHAAAHQLGRQDVALQRLSEHEDPGHQRDPAPIAPELHQRHPDGEPAAHDGADIGDEGHEARQRADHDAEVEPDEGERHGVERAEDQHHRSLAAQEAGQGRVDLAPEAPDRGGVLARQELVHAGDHAVPVEQEIECHDRHDHQKEDDSEDAPPRREDAREDRAAAFLEGRPGIGDELLDPGLVFEQEGEARREGAFGVDHARGEPWEAHDEGRDLVLQRQRRRHDHGDEEKHGDHGDHRDGPHAAEAEPFQPVGHGIEEVGDRPAQHEGQEHVAELP